MFYYAEFDLNLVCDSHNVYSSIELKMSGVLSKRCCAKLKSVVRNGLRSTSLTEVRSLFSLF